MSNAEVEEQVRPATLPEEYVRLERAVRRLLDDIAGYRARADVAERRASDLERTVEDMTTGALDPMELRSSLRRVEEENRELRRRMLEAQDRIRRLVARFDFLEEEM